MQVGLETYVPVIFGVLTVMNKDQAIVRSVGTYVLLTSFLFLSQSLLRLRKIILHYECCRRLFFSMILPDVFFMVTLISYYHISGFVAYVSLLFSIINKSVKQTLAPPIKHVTQYKNYNMLEQKGNKNNHTPIRNIFFSYIHT